MQSAMLCAITASLTPLPPPRPKEKDRIFGNSPTPVAALSAVQEPLFNRATDYTFIFICEIKISRVKVYWLVAGKAE
jgi:hypothetical protein